MKRHIKQIKTSKTKEKLKKNIKPDEINQNTYTKVIRERRQMRINICIKENYNTNTRSWRNTHEEEPMKYNSNTHTETSKGGEKTIKKH